MHPRRFYLLPQPANARRKFGTQNMLENRGAAQPHYNVLKTRSFFGLGLPGPRVTGCGLMRGSCGVVLVAGRCASWSSSDAMIQDAQPRHALIGRRWPIPVLQGGEDVNSRRRKSGTSRVDGSASAAVRAWRDSACRLCRGSRALALARDLRGTSLSADQHLYVLNELLEETDR